jgi:hypothetical protein
LKPNPPITDNNVNIRSTWKVAFRPSESRNVLTEAKPKPKKQHEKQPATRESRNFHQGKSRNLKKYRTPQKAIFRKKP